MEIGRVGNFFPGWFFPVEKTGKNRPGKNNFFHLKVEKTCEAGISRQNMWKQHMQQKFLGKKFLLTSLKCCILITLNPQKNDILHMFRCLFENIPLLILSVVFASCHQPKVTWSIVYSKTPKVFSSSCW